MADLKSINIPHDALVGLTDDDHSIYPLLAGRSGGQNLKGGTGSGDDLTLESTSNVTKGTISLDLLKFESPAVVNTSDATVTDLHTIALAEGKTVVVDALILARKTDLSLNDGWHIHACAHRATGGDVTLDGYDITQMVPASGFACTVAADTGNQTLDFKGTGIAATNVNWYCSVRYLLQ